jgi:ornithine decarboxylase
VRLTTFDTAGELAKLAAAAPGMEALLRIRADDASALCSLGSKYGVEPDLAPALLAAAAAARVPVVGVSFHVGSASQDPQARCA